MNYYLIGVKGSGLSSLALILKNLGNTVIGYDDEVKHQFTEPKLIENDIAIYTDGSYELKEGTIVIRSAAIKDEHPEIIKAKEKDLKIYDYNEFLGELTKEFKTIAIAGTHGKTTTTAMLKTVMDATIGANYLVGDGTGYANEENKLFLIEACEYRRHFLAYSPTITIITNIELDHPDYFKDLDDVIDAYQNFVNKTENKVVACGDDENVRKLKSDKIIYYGLKENNDIQARSIVYSSEGSSFDVYINNEFYSKFELPYFGEHIILNTLAVITVGYLENVSADEITKALKTFRGAKRRFSEEKIEDTIIIDDYAHHPTEIRVTISAAKQKYPDKEIVAIYQPHTYSRTGEFIKEYAEVLSEANEAYLLPIHPAREKQEDFPDVSEGLIVEKLENGHKLEMDNASKLAPHKGKVLLFMGASDLFNLREATKKVMN